MKVEKITEQEGCHPNLHLTSYRDIEVVLNYGSCLCDGILLLQGQNIVAIPFLVFVVQDVLTKLAFLIIHCQWCYLRLHLKTLTFWSKEQG